MIRKHLTLMLLLGSALAGCQGQTKVDPPVHLNLNMDFQTNFRGPQRENKFFNDGRSVRPIDPNTVSRGNLNDDEIYFAGKEGENFITRSPVPVTRELVERGRERYNIYCTPCHARTGAGDGRVVKRGLIPPPNFHDDRIVTMPAGQIFETITHGVRNMPAYGYAIPPQDRWAIVSYVRALQISHRASLDQVPADVAGSKGWKK